QPLAQLLEGHGPDARGGQLDREREAVEPGDHVVDEGGVEVRGGAGSPGASYEQRGAVCGGELVEQYDVLGGDVQRCPAGGDDAQVAGRDQEERDEGGDRLDDVLAVVED